MKRKIERVILEDKNFCDECGKEVPESGKWVFDEQGKHFCSEDCALTAFKKSMEPVKKIKKEMILKAPIEEPKPAVQVIQKEVVIETPSKRTIISTLEQPVVEESIKTCGIGQKDEIIESIISNSQKVNSLPPRPQRDYPNPLPYITAIGICIIMLIFLFGTIFNWW